MAAIVRASHAISFQLLNRDRHPILGIFDGQRGQTLKLDITNSSRRNMKPKKLDGAPTAANHNFELKFRPGTLVLTSTPAISVDAGWKISQPAVSDEGVSFYLLITNPEPVPPDSTISVTLNNLSGDGKRGAHGTRVELKWKDGSLEYSASAVGQSPEPLVAGHRIQHLSIVNESGQKHIPLHVGIVGNNKVLNDGTANTLTLRITNLLKPGERSGSIQLNSKTEPPESVFSISFDSGSANDAWALAELTKVKDIKIKAVAIKPKVPAIPFVVTAPTPLADSAMWSLWPTSSVSLGPDEFVEVTISDIMTSLPSGQTKVHVHYRNIPGYWDGDFVSVIEKAPLVYGPNGVGIGKAIPEATLDVKGTVRATATGKVNTGTATPGDGLHVVGDMLLGVRPCQIKCVDDDHRLIFDVNGFEIREKDKIVFSPGSVRNTKTEKAVILANGNVGMGPAIPEKHLHLKGGGDQEIMIESTDQGAVKWSLQSSGSSGRFELINRTANHSHFTMLKDGNVGIGTTNPGGHINEGNYFKADKDGRILEMHSPAHESALILSSAQDSDGAHLGGLYFTRTKGQADAHREVAAIKCKQAGGDKLGGGALQFFTKPHLGGVDFNGPRMVIRETGRVGIGTREPTKAVLEVVGSVDTEAPHGYRYMNIHKTENDHHKQTRPYSIWATARIAAEEFNAVSDERIKNIRGRSDGVTDLCTLLGIEITDYSFRDVIAKGAGVYKKVIGQQVEKVFPQAVSRQSDVVPDIYRQAPLQDGWVALATDLKTGDRVKLITESGREGTYEVLEVTPEKFRVDLEPEGEKVFVFGREVHDFLTVDYDAIAMLNVSATQQLKKEMDQELKALRVENAELRSANDALAKRLQLLETRLETAFGVVSANNGSNGNGRH